MPLKRLNLESSKFSFLKVLVDNRSKIVDEYNTMVGDIKYSIHFSERNWKLLMISNIKDGNVCEAINFPTLTKFIDNLKDKTLMSIVVSVMEYGDTLWHEELWTNVKGYHRIHIPLNVSDGASIDVVEDDGNAHNYNYELGSAYQFVNPYNMHKPSNFNKNGTTRMLLMIDYIDKNENPGITEKEMLELFDIEIFEKSPEELL